MSRLFSSACSGAMYSSVPTMVPTSVNRVRSVSCCWVALARPKSMTLGTGHVRVVHQSQGLALRLEARQDLARVHAGLDDLQRDLAADRFHLFRQEDGAHAAFAQVLQELVRPDPSTGRFGEGRVIGACG